MNLTNRINRNNILSPIIILMCIHVFNVVSENSSYNSNRSVTVSLQSHKNGTYDITTLYRLSKLPSRHSYPSSYFWSKGFEHETAILYMKRYHKDLSIEIHSKTNAIGMPIIIGKEIYTNFPRNNSLGLQITSSEFCKYGFIQNNSRMNVYFDSNYWNKSDIMLTGEECSESSVTYSYDTEKNNNTDKQLSQCYNALEYMYGQQYYYYDDYQPFLTIHWTPDKEETCLAITYLHRINSNMKIIMSVSDENETLIISPTLEKYNEIITLKITNLYLLKDYDYKIVLKRKYLDYGRYYGYNSYVGHWFGLFQITQCANDDEEEVKIVSIDEIGERPKPFNVLGHENTLTYSEFPKTTGACLNGGYMHHSESICVCPPGFDGWFCEIGCGPNFYGADCKGICSMYADKMCRGIYMCTDYGCTCPAGLTGPFCEKDCKFGKYGANCKQTCSKNCNNEACNSYTGVCSQGCLPGYIPPYCTEKYPYLINPPTLISNEYERIELKLDFQSNNIKGGNKQIKYYQLLYKSKDEDEFTKSVPKLLKFDNNTEITEILSNLKPDTTYIVGALLITDKGNFNDEDIVYGHYRTSCIQPQITDYNITMISGVKKINITWKKITPKQLECSITEYILTLSFDHAQNKISGIQEILSSSHTGHVIVDLIPGYLYNIVLTPKTNKGLLPSSPAYTASPLLLFSDNDVAVTDIVTTVDEEKIKVSWKLVNSYQPYNTVNVPVTLIVKYKINRILSCSLKEIESNWTKITLYNRTHYEIYDTIPNSQYCIQISILQDKSTVQRENIAYELTSASKPEIEPVFDIDHPIYITNDSVFVQWKFDPINCSKLNGFFLTYFIELKDTYNDIVQLIETQNNQIYIDGLESNSSYKLKIFIKTHIGYNQDHFLYTNFTTKIGNLKSVDNLVVYKKSLKYRMVGLRWSYSGTENINGFLASFNPDFFINTLNTSEIPPTKCTAWPDYYCHTFHNLSPSYNYTFKIQPKSLEYPQGGKATTISFSMAEEIPEPPNNITVIEIGRNYMTLQWNIPWIFNGALNLFIINIEEISALDMSKCCTGIIPIEIPIEEEIPSYNYTIMGLKPGSTYSAGVISVSKSFWYSSPARIEITTLLDDM